MVVELSDLIDLMHPKCGLGSLAFMASGFELYEMILDDEFNSSRPSSVSLFVICTTSNDAKPSLVCEADDLGFEALRVRNVDIAGQVAYNAYPLWILGAKDIE
jgi:hypothetical protein